MRRKLLDLGEKFEEGMSRSLSLDSTCFRLGSAYLFPPLPLPSIWNQQRLHSGLLVYSCRRLAPSGVCLGSMSRRNAG